MNKLTLIILTLILLGGCMSPSQKYSNLDPSKGAKKFTFWERMALMKKVFVDKSERAPTTKLPEVKPDLAVFADNAQSLKFIWFGHSTILLHIQGRNVLIDPIFSGAASPVSFLVKRFQPPVLGLTELPAIDLIIISHDHYDHLDKETIKYFSQTQAEFVVPMGVGNHLRDWGVKTASITELNWNESVEKVGLKLTATPAQHFSGRTFFDGNSTLWASWVIKSPNESVFFSGDTGYNEHFKTIGSEHGPFDYAFIENGQYNERWRDMHLHPEETIQAMKDLRAKAFIPIHWGMFNLSFHQWNEPIERSYQLASREKLKILTPRLGEVVSHDTQDFYPWWEIQNNSTQE